MANISPQKRAKRNKAEKNRRDKFNDIIHELGIQVPTLNILSKQVNKITTIRLAAAFFRLLDYDFFQQDNAPDWLRQSPASNELIKIIKQSMHGFLILIDGYGKILFVSNSCAQYLSSQHVDLMGCKFTEFVHTSDADDVETALKNAINQIIYGERQISQRFTCRFRLKQKQQSHPRKDDFTYLNVEMTGFMAELQDKFEKGIFNYKLADVNELNGLYTPDKLDNIMSLLSNEEQDEQLERQIDQNRKRNIEFRLSNIIFKGFIQIVPHSATNDLVLADANKDEYLTRLSLDGTLIFSDQRITLITGYSPAEVIGRSAYDFILTEDHNISLFAHKLMLNNTDGTGLIVHRLRTANGGFVYLHSAGCLQYKKGTQEVDHFVCMSRYMAQSEGDVRRQMFEKEFHPMIKNQSTHELINELYVEIGPRGSTTRNIRTSSNEVIVHDVNRRNCINSLVEHQPHSNQSMVIEDVTESDFGDHQNLEELLDETPNTARLDMNAVVDINHNTIDLINCDDGYWQREKENVVFLNTSQNSMKSDSSHDSQSKSSQYANTDRQIESINGLRVICDPPSKFVPPEHFPSVQGRYFTVDSNRNPQTPKQLSSFVPLRPEKLRNASTAQPNPQGLLKSLFSKSISKDFTHINPVRRSGPANVASQPSLTVANLKGNTRNTSSHLSANAKHTLSMKTMSSFDQRGDLVSHAVVLGVIDESTPSSSATGSKAHTAKNQELIDNSLRRAEFQVAHLRQSPANLPQTNSLHTSVVQRFPDSNSNENQQRSPLPHFPVTYSETNSNIGGNNPRISTIRRSHVHLTPEEAASLNPLMCDDPSLFMRGLADTISQQQFQNFTNKFAKASSSNTNSAATASASLTQASKPSFTIDHSHPYNNGSFYSVLPNTLPNNGRQQIQTQPYGFNDRPEQSTNFQMFQHQNPKHFTLPSPIYPSNSSSSDSSHFSPMTANHCPAHLNTETAYNQNTIPSPLNGEHFGGNGFGNLSGNEYLHRSLDSVVSPNNNMANSHLVRDYQFSDQISLESLTNGQAGFICDQENGIRGVQPEPSTIRMSPADTSFYSQVANDSNLGTFLDSGNQVDHNLQQLWVLNEQKQKVPHDVPNGQTVNGTPSMIVCNDSSSLSSNFSLPVRDRSEQSLFNSSGSDSLPFPQSLKMVSNHELSSFGLPIEMDNEQTIHNFQQMDNEQTVKIVGQHFYKHLAYKNPDLVNFDYDEQSLDLIELSSNFGTGMKRKSSPTKLDSLGSTKNDYLPSKKKDMSNGRDQTSLTMNVN